MFRVDLLGITEQDFDQMTGFHFIPEVFYSVIIMIIISIFAIVVYFVFKKANKNPLQEPKGLVFLMYYAVTTIEEFTVGIMGERNRNFSGYFLGLMPYVFLTFVFGLTGLSSPMTYFGIPLALSLATFLMFHFMAMKENKWGYFKRFVDPIPIFLPINLVTMWAPLLSLALRMFGNALSGFCIMGLVYAALEGISGDIFRPIFGLVGAAGVTQADIWLAPIITPVLHLYFDLFSGAVQTLVFTMLTMIFIAQEQNEESAEEVLDRVQFDNKQEV